MRKEGKKVKNYTALKIIGLVIMTGAVFAVGYVTTGSITVFLESTGGAQGKQTPGTKQEELAEPENIDDNSVLPEESTLLPEDNSATEQKSTTLKSVTTTALSKNSPVADVVNYFNVSANKVKSVPAKSVTWVYEDITLDEEYSDVPAGLKPWLGPVNKMMKTSQKKEVYSTQEEINNAFGVDGETWSSKLTADAIREYSCGESGGNYKIKLVLKDEPTPNVYHGEGYAGKAFYVLRKDQIELEGLVNIKNVSLTYHDCTIECTIDKKTGNLKEITYTMPTVLYLEALGMTATVGFTIKKNFTVQW